MGSQIADVSLGRSEWTISCSLFGSLISFAMACHRLLKSVVLLVVTCPDIPRSFTFCGFSIFQRVARLYETIGTVSFKIIKKRVCTVLALNALIVSWFIAANSCTVWTRFFSCWEGPVGCLAVINS